MECGIRSWRLADAPDLAEMLNNPNVQDFLRDGLPFPYTKNDALAYIQTMLDADKHTTFAFAVTVDDRAVGSIGAFRKENIHARTAQMGYYVAEPFWGRGIGSSAVKQIRQYLFDHTDMIRIFAEPFSHNAASCRILEKSGFQLEGILRSNAVKNNQIIDMKMYALVKNVRC